jgi:hypothetical protein
MYNSYSLARVEQFILTLITFSGLTLYERQLASQNSTFCVLVNEAWRQENFLNCGLVCFTAIHN